MKKYIIIIQIIVLNNYCFAQNNLLKNKNWEIQKYYSVFDESIKDTIFSFSINNPESILNYKDLTFIFNDDNTYHTFFKNDSSIKTNEKWLFTKNNDSIVINNRNYHVVKLTEDELLISLRKHYINSPVEQLYPMTDFYNFKLATALSINQNKIDKKHKSFPSPVVDKLFLTFESSLNAAKVEIYALDGKKIVSQVVKPNQETQEINVQEFPKGFYVLKIKDKNDKLLDSGKILKK
jgi:Secretion system C-terminal sorting domain